ncbi:GNAT family N-acetyltransferase [Cognatishimia sp. WU-CL00825]|uniref:GNAT family N-acetyltransferase n=1 Tax=Cognatishimia sp. WU-CL00825 TaxID=3127658 RepID=UPI00310A7279
MILRDATANDAKSIAAIWNAEIRDGISTFNSTEKSIKDVTQLVSARRGCFLVAELQGRVVGFGTLGPFRAGPGYAHCKEHSLYLLASAQGKSIGSALLRALEQVARQSDVHVLVAAIGGENTGAVDFHTHMGFEHVGQMPEVGRKFDRWMNLILMQKIVTR